MNQQIIARSVLLVIVTLTMACVGMILLGCNGHMSSGENCLETLAFANEAIPASEAVVSMVLLTVLVSSFFTARIENYVSLPTVLKLQRQPVGRIETDFVIRLLQQGLQKNIVYSRP